MVAGAPDRHLGASAVLQGPSCEELAPRAKNVLLDRSASCLLVSYGTLAFGNRAPSYCRRGVVAVHFCAVRRFV